MSESRLQRIAQQKASIRKISLVFGLCLVVISIFIIIKIAGFYSSIHTNTQDSRVEKEKNIYNILILGYGGGNHAGAYLTDTIMVVHADLEQKKLLLISLPRDIWVRVPTKDGIFHSKVNAVYQMGLFPENYPNLDPAFQHEDNPSGYIKNVVEKMTGLPIDGFIAIDFEGFVKTVDKLNGIEIEVEKEFYDYEYPITGKEDDVCELVDEQLDEALRIATISSVLDAFPCRFETLHFLRGTNYMDGETALKFARSRHSSEDGGDFNRTKRQQLVIEAVKNKMLRIGFIPKILPLMDELQNHIVTDISVSDLQKFIFETRNSDQYIAQTFVVDDTYLTSDYSNEGQYIIIPEAGLDNWVEIKIAVKRLIEGITPTIESPTILENQ